MMVRLASLLLLAGCAATDPLLRAGAWQPGGVNDTNLLVSLQQPTDLVRGRGEGPRLDSMLAERAIRRLRADRVKPLSGGLVGELRTEKGQSAGDAAPAGPDGAAAGEDAGASAVAAAAP